MSSDPIETGFLNAKDAYDLDQHLFQNGYSLEQLMELAGLSVAEAVYEVLSDDDKFSTIAVKDKKPRRILVSSYFWAKHFQLEGLIEILLLIITEKNQKADTNLRHGSHLYVIKSMKNQYAA